MSRSRKGGAKFLRWAQVHIDIVISVQSSTWMLHKKVCSLLLAHPVVKHGSNKLHRCFFPRSWAFHSRGAFYLYMTITSKHSRMYKTHEERTSAEERDKRLYPVILDNIEQVNSEVRLLRLRKKEPEDHIKARFSSPTSTHLC